MSDVDNQELLPLVERFKKLSAPPYNPRLAYRNLEMIHALAESLHKRLLDPENTAPLNPGPTQTTETPITAAGADTDALDNQATGTD